MRAALVTVVLFAGTALASNIPIETVYYTIEVDGEIADGQLSYPTDRTPTGLLVYGHGCCGKHDWRQHIEPFAKSYGVAVVAMHYRGPGGWDVMNGHRDIIAATEDLQARWPIERTVLYGASMGGSTTGMALAARPDLYDHWVSTFGVSNLFEQYALMPTWPCTCVDGAIVRETGGTPAEVPEEYRKRSPAFLADQMVGVKRVYLNHGVGDPVVTYSQSVQMFNALVEAGVPVSMYTATTGEGGTQLVYAPIINRPVLPTPYGPAGHDGRSMQSNFWVIGELFAGREPDAGLPAMHHVDDQTVRQRVP